jgi:predicted nucleotidyltransferase
MKQPNWSKCTEKQMWEYVATHLAKRGVETVMVGGSVVSVYTDGLYQSGDIDL